MKKTIIIVVALLLVQAGVYIWAKNTNLAKQEATMTNGQMLQSNKAVSIVTQENVQYFANAHGYFARPEAAGNYLGVVMIHENRGLRPEIKSMADQLAKEGYMVLAVDLYKGQVVENQEEARALSSNFDQKTGIENMKSAVAFLRHQGAIRVASLGWCFGGRQSVALAISGEKLDATVVYYGSNMASTKKELEPIKWPVLGIFGDKDQAVPVTKVKEFETSLNELGIENEIYIYPGVGHAFANPSGMNYAAKETKDAWTKTVAFLDKYLKN